MTLRFIVPRNTFKPAALERQLKLVPFHDSPTPVHCDSRRLVVEDAGPVQAVILTCHSAADVETPEFDAFLARAVAAYTGRGTGGKLVVASELS